MQHHPLTEVPQHDSVLRHPIRAAVGEAAHLHEVAEKGASPATPAILVGAVLAVVVPLAALLMLLAFGSEHLA